MYTLQQDNNYIYVLLTTSQKQVARFQRILNVVDNTGSFSAFCLASSFSVNYVSGLPVPEFRSYSVVQNMSNNTLANICQRLNQLSNVFLATPLDSSISISVKSDYLNRDLFSFIVPNSYNDYYYNSDSFDTELYPELLDNEETMLSLKNWINDTGSWDTYTDKDFKAMELIEKYNKNVLLLRSVRKIKLTESVVTSSSDSFSDEVDLSGIENKLQSISDKLQTTEIIDNSQKSITDVLNQQANTIQVDEIGLLRSKKGYY